MADLEELDIDSLLNTINSLVSVSGGMAETGSQTDDMPQRPEAGLISGGFGDTQAEEIIKGLDAGLDVDIYAKAEYNWMQMYEIRMGLLDHLDVSFYTSPLYSSRQMREIRLGLLDHLDVSSYANLVLTAAEMQTIRKVLFSNAYKSSPRGFGRTMTDEDTGIVIRISDDCMKAYAALPAAAEDLSEDDLRQALENYEITCGLLDENIRGIVQNKTAGREVCVAQGKSPTIGKDGWYELFFDNCIEKGHTVPPDGEIDYTDVLTVEHIAPGDRLAQYHPAQRDTGGMTVTGIPVEGTPGLELPALTGVGFSVDKASGLYTATNSGCASYNDSTGSLNVWKIYQINGDVCYYQSVEFEGTVHVTGSVRTMSTVRAKGDIIIDGFVESATVISEQNIVIKGGVNGGGQGRIEAGGSIRANFFENIDVTAKGMIESNYYFNSNIVTEDRLVARGRKARILGGRISAALSVDTVIVGDYLSSKTLFNVGDLHALDKSITALAMDRKTIMEELQQLSAGKQKLLLLLGEEQAEGNALYDKTCLAIQTKEHQFQAVDHEISRLRTVKKRAEQAYIKIHGQLQSDVVIIINNVKKETPTPLGKSIVLTKKDCLRKPK